MEAEFHRSLERGANSAQSRVHSTMAIGTEEPRELEWVGLAVTTRAVRTTRRRLLRYAQVRKLMEQLKKHGKLGLAAARAGLDHKTAAKYRDAGKLPSEMKAPREWRHRRFASRPALAAGDGPIGLYRQWTLQFCAASPTAGGHPTPAGA